MDRRSDTFAVRDPLWNTIRLDATARRIVNSPGFQRLRYIKQLGLAHLVYPGATHTRFDHALGVYHLMRRALEGLREQGDLDDVPPADPALIPLAGLLHDIGHYPFSHALEELAEMGEVGHHEALVGRFLAEPTVGGALAEVGEGAAARVEDLIRGRSDSPLQGLVSGSLDLDKIEYLKRDARFCGVPYGEVDVDRLLHSLVLVRDPGSGRLELGVREKGVAALESLLFAKYQMFRNVYWHHAVRAATVLYKRIVSDALAAGLLSAEDLVGRADEELLFLLQSRAGDGPVGERLRDLRARRLPKRAAEVVAAELEGGAVGEWLATDTPLKRRIEDRLAGELELPAGAVYLDYPEKGHMFGLDLLVLRRTGEALRLGPGGRVGLIGLPRVADELYRTARVLRLFTHGRRLRVEAQALARLALLTADEAEARVAGGGALLEGRFSG
ncbi:MAG TPA: HD domain-containing protein [Longimicrobiales bacterium]|nr:HD domain-containing protein [Longimicrobiales bacterium]